MSRDKVVLGIGAFVTGVGVGALAAKVLLEDKLREESMLQIEMIQNSYAAAIALRDAQDIVVAEHVKNISEEVERQIDVLDVPIGEVVEVRNTEDGIEVDFKTNPYHDAVEASLSQAVPKGDVEPSQFTYIGEEDYLDDEDGRPKLKVEILVDDGNPLFMMEGDAIDDWEDRIGESILRDMFQMCPPGTEQILYVRNHRDDEDYEVVRAEP